MPHRVAVPAALIAARTELVEAIHKCESLAEARTLEGVPTGPLLRVVNRLHTVEMHLESAQLLIEFFGVTGEAPRAQGAPFTSEPLERPAGATPGSISLTA